MKSYLHTIAFLACLILVGCSKDSSKNGADENGLCTSEVIDLNNEIVTTNRKTLKLFSDYQSVADSCSKLLSIMGATNTCLAKDVERGGGTISMSYANVKPACDNATRVLNIGSLTNSNEPKLCSEKIIESYNTVVNSIYDVSVQKESYSDAKLSCDYFKLNIGNTSCLASKANQNVALSYGLVEKDCADIARKANEVQVVKPNEPVVIGAYDGRKIADLNKIELIILNELAVNLAITSQEVLSIQNGKLNMNNITYNPSKNSCALIATSKAYSVRNSETIKMKLNFEDDNSISLVSSDSHLYITCMKKENPKSNWTVQDAKDTLNGIFSVITPEGSGLITK